MLCKCWTLEQRWNWDLCIIMFCLSRVKVDLDVLHNLVRFNAQFTGQEQKSGASLISNYLNCQWQKIIVLQMRVHCDSWSYIHNYQTNWNSEYEYVCWVFMATMLSNSTACDSGRLISVPKCADYIATICKLPTLFNHVSAKHNNTNVNIIHQSFSWLFHFSSKSKLDTHIKITVQLLILATSAWMQFYISAILSAWNMR